MTVRRRSASSLPGSARPRSWKRRNASWSTSSAIAELPIINTASLNNFVAWARYSASRRSKSSTRDISTAMTPHRRAIVDREPAVPTKLPVGTACRRSTGRWSLDETYVRVAASGAVAAPFDIGCEQSCPPRSSRHHALGSVESASIAGASHWARRSSSHGGYSSGTSGKASTPCCARQVLERLRLVAPRPRIAHHHLEHHCACGSGAHRTERRAERQLDMRARRAEPVAEPDLTFDDEHDVGAVVAMPSDDHAGVVARRKATGTSAPRRTRATSPTPTTLNRRHSAGASPVATPGQRSSR